MNRSATIVWLFMEPRDWFSLGTIIVAVVTYVWTQYVKSQERRLDLKRQTYMAVWEAWQRLALAVRLLPTKMILASITKNHGEDDSSSWGIQPGRSFRELIETFKVLDQADVSMSVIRLSASGPLLDELLKIEQIHQDLIPPLIELKGIQDGERVRNDKEISDFPELVKKKLIPKTPPPGLTEEKAEMMRRTIQKIIDEKLIFLSEKAALHAQDRDRIFLRHCVLAAQKLEEGTIEAKVLMKKELAEEDSWKWLRPVIQLIYGKSGDVNSAEFRVKLTTALTNQEEMDRRVIYSVGRRD